MSTNSPDSRSARHNSELPGADNDYVTARHRRAGDPRDVCSSLHTLRTDADRVCLTGPTGIADLYVVAPRGEVEAGLETHADIVLTRGVAVERLGVGGHVCVSRLLL